MTFIVGLTGGIGSGKSTIAALFADLNVPIIDADIVARQVVEKGSPLLDRIVAYFGETILLANGELNREKLRQAVFHHPEKKQWLNQLMHPAIRLEMLDQLAKLNAPYALWVVPLLIENQLTTFCQRVLVIDVEPDIQLARASSRDKDTDTVKKIINSQVSREMRLQFADDIIENNLPLAANLPSLKQQVAHLHQHYLQLSQQKNLRKLNEQSDRELPNL